MFGCKSCGKGWVKLLKSRYGTCYLQVACNREVIILHWTRLNAAGSAFVCIEKVAKKNACFQKFEFGAASDWCHGSLNGFSAAPNYSRSTETWTVMSYSRRQTRNLSTDVKLRLYIYAWISTYVMSIYLQMHILTSRSCHMGLGSEQALAFSLR